MNLLHLADLHLGKRVNGFDLLPDQRYILEQVLDLCTAHNVQAVALAGDIYDTALPPAAAVLLLDWFLTELAHRNIPVLAIAGNHDSAERLDYAAGLLSNQQVYLAGQFTSAPRRVILQDEFGELTFDLLPFVRPATVRHCLPDTDIRDEDSAIAAALEEGRVTAIAALNVFSAGYLAVDAAAALARHEDWTGVPTVAFSIVRQENMYDSDNQKLLFPVT